MSYLYDKSSILTSINGQLIEIYRSQKGIAVVCEAVPCYVTIVSGVKVDQASLAAALAALE